MSHVANTAGDLSLIRKSTPVETISCYQFKQHRKQITIEILQSEETMLTAFGSRRSRRSPMLFFMMYLLEKNFVY